MTHISFSAYLFLHLFHMHVKCNKTDILFPKLIVNFKIGDRSQL